MKYIVLWTTFQHLSLKLHLISAALSFQYPAIKEQIVSIYVKNRTRLTLNILV
jgi:hypothetical protein